MENFNNYLDCDHFVTFTLKPIIYDLNCRTQIRKTIPHILKTLNNVSNKWIIVAELTKANNIHYHAMVKYKDEEISEFQLVDQLKDNKYIGTSFITERYQGVDGTGNIQYMIKHILITQKKLNPKGKTIIPVYWESAKYNPNTKHINIRSICTQCLDIDENDYMII